MYAIVEINGQQFKAEAGQKLFVHHIEGAENGSTVEFETENADIAHKLLEAKDYFNHPHNPDFKNLDFENEFFGFKLKDDGAKGNIYLIQRYET